MRLFSEFFAAVPWFLPGILCWSVVSAVLAPFVGRALGSRPSVAFAALVSFGVVVLATLTPTAVALASPDPTFEWCDLDRLTFPSPSELLSIDDTLRNVLLFIPLGFTLGLLARTRAAASLVVLAYLLPLVIELLQLALPPLGRGCQSADVIDNLTGLTVGLVGATMLLRVTRWSFANPAANR